MDVLSVRNVYEDAERAKRDSLLEAKEEAKCFLEYIKGKTFEYPVYLDMEEATQETLGKDLLGNTKGIQLHTFLPVKHRKILGKIKTAVRRKALKHRLSAADQGHIGPGGMILHNENLQKRSSSPLTAQKMNFLPKKLSFRLDI